MTLLDAIFVGIVEGITEFLPISSTGHMIVASDLLGLVQDDTLKSFQVIIQGAAVLAVVLYYWREIPTLRHLLPFVAIACVPVAGLGLLFEDQIKSLFSVSVVAWMFIIGGVIFLITEYFYSKKVKRSPGELTSVENINIKQSLIIGLCQVLSLIPGTSRSGATIVGGLWLGLTRTAATEFSFLLAIPIVGGATLFDLSKSYNSFSGTDGLNLIVGFVSAFVIAYFSLGFLLKYVAKYSFVIFGYYRIVFGFLLLTFYI